MPRYPWLLEDELDTKYLKSKINVMRTLGVPYEVGYEEIALGDLQSQAKQIAENLKKDGVEDQGIETKEITALIAYLQRLGTDIKKNDSSTQPK